MNRFAWTSPVTVFQASNAASAIVAEAMTAPGGGTTAVVKAGGIDLLDLMKEGILSPDTLVNLGAVSALDGVAESKKGLRIGAMVTLAHLAVHPLVRLHYPALAEAVGATASPQIRNIATLGGNLLQRPRCWYFRAQQFHCLRKGGGHCFALTGENQYHAIFDNLACAIVHPSTVATMLVALNAKVELEGPHGTSRTLLLENFFVPPGRDLHRENDLHPHEILTAIHLPVIASNLRMAHMKQGERDSFDWPLADVAVALTMSAEGRCSNAAVVLGAAAPRPHRAGAAEHLLIGQRIDPELAAMAGKAALDGAMPLAKNAYKLPIFETLVRRAILKAAMS